MFKQEPSQNRTEKRERANRVTGRAKQFASVAIRRCRAAKEVLLREPLGALEVL
jgi:hypothetical protein